MSGPGSCRRFTGLVVAAVLVGCGQEDAPRAAAISEVELPSPSTDGDVAVEAALATRRSVREYDPTPPTLPELAQLLWAAQGVTDDEGRRTAPSAGAKYPLEIYVGVSSVDGLQPGLYRYRSAGHALERLTDVDPRAAIVDAAGQDWLANAPALLVIAAIYGKTRERYGEKGVQHVHVEVGHVAQNLYLQATSIGLGTVMVGGFHDARLAEAVGLGAEEEPMAIMPIGRVVAADDD